MAKISLTIPSNRSTSIGEHTVMLQISSHFKTERIATGGQVLIKKINEKF